MADPERVGPKTIRKQLLEDDIARLGYLTSGLLPFMHAAILAQAKESADSIREMLPDHPHPEHAHESLDRAMAEAAEKAEEAFEAALMAAWKFHWLSENCKCKACKLRRLREHASDN